MINLLPPERLRAVRTEYRLRVLTVGGWLFACLLLIALILLAVLYLTVRVRVQNLEVSLAREQAAMPAGLAENLKLSAKQVALLNSAASRPTFTEAVMSVLKHQTAGVSVSNFSYDQDQNRLQIEGVAWTRTGLLDFVEKLRSDKAFRQVDSPVSNLIKESNVNFAITIYLNEN